MEIRSLAVDTMALNPGVLPFARTISTNFRRTCAMQAQKIDAMVARQCQHLAEDRLMVGVFRDQKLDDHRRCQKAFRHERLWRCAAMHSAEWLTGVGVAYGRDALDVVFGGHDGETFGDIAPQFTGQCSIRQRRWRLIDENVHTAQTGG